MFWLTFIAYNYCCSHRYIKSGILLLNIVYSLEMNFDLVECVVNIKIAKK